MKIFRLLVAILLMGLFTSTQTTTDEKPVEKKPYDDVVLNWSDTFGEVLRLAKDEHYRIDNPEKAMIGAINGFLSALDPHSSFLDPKARKAIEEATRGEFSGIGIVIDGTRKPKDRFLMVVDIIAEGPSEKAGLLPYDKIIEIDSKTLEGMTTDEATAKLRGERGTTVHIKILRDNKPEPLSFDIVRDVVKEQTSLAFYLKDFDIYYISLTNFTKNAVKQIEELLKKSTKQRYRGLILDLRNNPGGLLDSAIDIAGMFLEKGSLVVSARDKRNQETERYATKRKPVSNNGLPIFILTNNFTASAAEILAGCLKIHSNKIAIESKGKQQKQLMVFLIGVTTFGKGSIQKVVPVGNHSAAKITTALYYLPDGKTIQGTGIEPDFMVAKQFPPPEQVEWFKKFYGHEDALKDYIKAYDQNGETEKKEGGDKKTDSSKKEKEAEKPSDKKKPKNWAERTRENLAKDNQFLSAITLINLLDSIGSKLPELVSDRAKAIEYLKSVFAINGKLNMDEIKG